MENEPLDQLFHAIADEELASLTARIPSDADHRFLLFMEALRVVEFWTVINPSLAPEKRLSEPDLHIIQSGWNLAAAQLLDPLKTQGAIPMSKSTPQTRSSAMGLLHQFGRSVLMHRATDMLHYGILIGDRNATGFVLRKNGRVDLQFLDMIDTDHLEKLKVEIRRYGRKDYNGWDLFDPEEFDKFKHRDGNFLPRPQRPHSERRDDSAVDSLMVPLLRPWDSGHGIMMGYDALPEVDNHFLDEATDMISSCMAEAGIHPDALLERSTGADVAAISTLVVSFHLKHVRFALLASKHYPQISIPQSLTVWSPQQDWEQNIAEFTGFELSRVRHAVAAIMMRPQDVTLLSRHTMPFMPLLIGLDNGFILHPVSSLARNPLLGVSTLLQHRDPSVTTALSKHREDWMRSEMYGLFSGRRYICVKGAIKIRKSDKLATDIDAAVFDRATGELALIQIKWQDYFTNDVRKFRSKSSNLAKELDEWAHQVSEWVQREGQSGISNTLRLSTQKDSAISGIYLFGLSRSLSRVEGFGFSTKCASLALANWPQFERVRLEVGPAKQVFHEMHRRLKSDANKRINLHPITFEITVAGRLVRFEDLWNSVD